MLSRKTNVKIVVIDINSSATIKGAFLLMNWLFGNSILLDKGEDVGSNEESWNDWDDLEEEARRRNTVVH